MKRCFSGSLSFKVSSLLPLLSVVAACGSKSKSSSSTDKTDGGSTEAIVTTIKNGLAAAFPSGLVISSPTAISKASSSLTSPTSMGLASSLKEQSTAESMEDKEKRITTLLEATTIADCLPPMFVKKVPSPSCYANSVEATGSDTLGKDATGTLITDIFLPTNLNPVMNGKRGVRGGDALVMTAMQGTGDSAVPCLPAVTDYRVENASEQVERAQIFVASMMCVSKVTGKTSLPAVGEKLDLAEALKEGWKNAAVTLDVKEATIEAVGTVDDPVYTSFVKMNFQAPKRDGAPGETETRNLTIQLTNNPEKTNGDNYKGRLVIYEGGIKDQQNGGAQIAATTIGYSRSGDTINYKLQSANFHVGSDAEKNNPNSFIDTKTGFFDFASIKTKASTGAPPAHNAVEALFTFNRADKTGDFVYSWQAGMGDAATRTMVVNVTKNETTGDLEGCGLAGFGGRFGSADQGKVTGFWCGWAQESNTESLHANAPFAQKQCFKKTAAGTKWELTESHIQYSVAKNCGKQEGTLFDLVDVKSDGTGSTDVVVPNITLPTLSTEISKDKMVVSE